MNITGWSNLREFHHSNSYGDSVVCMASTCLYVLLKPSGHAPDESTDGVLGDLLPDLDHNISELLDSVWLYSVGAQLDLGRV